MDTKTRQQLYRQRQAALGHKRLTVHVPKSIVDAVDKEASARKVARDVVIAERLRDSMRSTRLTSLSEIETATWLEQLVTAIYACSQIATATKQRSVLQKVGLACDIAAAAYEAMPQDIQHTVAGQRLAVAVAKAAEAGMLTRGSAERTPAVAPRNPRPPAGGAPLKPQNAAGASRTPKSRVSVRSVAPVAQKPRKMRLKVWRNELGLGRKRRLIVVVAPSLREAARLVGETQRSFKLDWKEASALFAQELADTRGVGFGIPIRGACA